MYVGTVRVPSVSSMGAEFCQKPTCRSLSPKKILWPLPRRHEEVETERSGKAANARGHLAYNIAADVIVTQSCHLLVLTNWKHCPSFLKPKDLQPSFSQLSLLLGTGAVKEVICVRQILLSPSIPIYSLADQNVLPSR